MRTLLVVCIIYLLVNFSISDISDERESKQFSLFSVVQFPNDECISTSSSTTCGSTISTNTSYIRNPGYPSTYTPTTGGTCVFTINKVSDDICQLRLDFQTFSGFTVSTVAA